MNAKKEETKTEAEKPRLDQVAVDVIDQPIEEPEDMDQPVAEGGKSESCKDVSSPTKLMVIKLQSTAK